MNIKCCVRNCKDKTSRRARFPHPKNDHHNRYWKWLELIGDPELMKIDPMKVYANKRICARHFSCSCYVIGTKKLKRNALPDLGVCGEDFSSSSTTYLALEKQGLLQVGSRVRTYIANVSQPPLDTSIVWEDGPLNLDPREASKEQCTLEGIDIGGDIDSTEPRHCFELASAFTQDVNVRNGPIARNLKPWPSEDDMQHFLPSLYQLLSHSNTSQKNFEEGSAGSAGSTSDNESACADTEIAEEISMGDEGKSLSHTDKRDLECSNERQEELTEEDNVVQFFAKACWITLKLSEELQMKIKRDILDSIKRTEKQCEGMN